MGHALVIGASGGLGAALADALARAHDVTRLSRSADGLEVTDEATVAAAMARLAAPVDVAFLATGILAPRGASPEKALDAIDPAAMARTLAVNAIGPALVLKHLAPRLAEGARVGVLTARVGSIGDNRLGGWHSYRASKAAANMILRGAAIEIGRRRRGAVVVALHPGTVETAFTRGYKAAKLAPAEAAARLVAVLEALGPGDSGGFFDHAGARIDW